MKILHLVKVHWDRRGSHATKEWFEKRFKLFRDYTLHSLQSQTFRDFVIWHHCDPNMQVLMDPLVREAEVSPGKFGFTFLPYGNRPTLDIAKDADYVYVTRLDSDDLLSNDALECVNDLRPKTSDKVEAGVFCRGWMYDIRSSRLGVYVNSSSPFHTLMFPAAIWNDPEAYRRSFIGDHSRVASSYLTHRLPDWKFTVLVHDSNFISTFQYGLDKLAPVEHNWSLDRWSTQPVVFDVDDFCDEYNCLPELDELKQMYPNLRCTLFTIPATTSLELLREAKKRDWIELALHGITHKPNLEMGVRTHQDIVNYYEAMRHEGTLDFYTPGFRPPGWFLTNDTINACNDLGFWVALHERDATKMGKYCRHGHYYCGARLPYWHAHSHDTCNNWLKADLPRLKTMWPENQQFSWVSESILVPQSA